MSERRRIAVRVAAVVPFLFAAVTHADEAAASPPPNAFTVTVLGRCAHNPLIRPEMSPTLGQSVAFPSLIRTPDWLPGRLGRYYLYFENHRGHFIRLAFADELCGPWTLYEPGMLHLEDLPELVQHVASPEARVDSETHQIRLYFHGRLHEDRAHRGCLAVSHDGLHFELVSTNLSPPYLRVFEWRGQLYGIAKDGQRGALLAKRPWPHGSFERIREVLPRMRHAGVLVRGDHLLVFYTRKGDVPERILMSSIALGPDPRSWVPSEPIEVLRSETDYEGVQYPLDRPDGKIVPRHQLRDPFVYEEGGHTWLLYSVAGENGIALAEIHVQPVSRSGEEIPTRGE